MTLPDFSHLAEALKLKFSHLDLLRQALTHRSYLNEHPSSKLEHNERLEFLGDAVLELVVTDYLYAKFPEANEGDLTAYRAALVNAETLGNLGQDLGFEPYLLLSRGEAKDNGRARQAILANTYEAIIGAIYLDQGYVAARNFISDHLFPLTHKIIAAGLWQDAKSHFQEQAQATAEITPTYKVISEHGPDHDKMFTVGLYLGSELVTEGTGPSKQRAEQDAARRGLAKRGWTKKRAKE